jgi:hypothetical protein
MLRPEGSGKEVKYITSAGFEPGRGDAISRCPPTGVLAAGLLQLPDPADVTSPIA